MAKKKKRRNIPKNPNQNQNADKVMDFEDATNMTVGEINDKTTPDEFIIEVTESPLDKYIREHRDQIEEAKTKGVDSIIQEERQKLEETEEKKQENILRKAAQIAVPTIGAVATEEIVAKTVKEESNSQEISEPLSTKENAENNTPKPQAEVPASEVQKESENESLSTREEQSATDEQASSSVEEVASESTHGEQVASPEESEKETVDGSNEMDPVVFAEAPVSTEKEKSQETTAPIAATVAGATVLSANQAELQNKQENSTQKEDQANRSEESGKTQDSDSNEEKSNKKPIIIGAVAVALLGIGGYGIAHMNNNSSANKSAQSSMSSSNSNNMADFNNAYNQFFTDSSDQSLKNSNFSKLGDLQKDLDKLKGSSNYDAAQSKYNDLKAMVDATNQVNDLFDKPAIVDGKLDSSAKVKASVQSLPNIVKTSNTTLNGLIDKAISQAKSQQAQAKKNAETAASKAAQAQQSTSNNSSKNNTSTNASANNGAQNPSGATVDNSNARVQPQANLNINDPAFSWNTGVMDRILNTARSRGYFSGNDYILIPVAIHTTNGVGGGPAGIVAGYYNLYRTDGTYLASINCKTGYWFGNGKGLPADY